MKKSISEKRKRLLAELESIVGNSFYNGHIQNYGSGGVREADGRGFRYPITFYEPNRAKIKVKDHQVPPSIPAGIFLSGYYAVGANQLDVMSALDSILRHLESKHGLVVEGPEEKRETQ